MEQDAGHSGVSALVRYLGRDARKDFRFFLGSAFIVLTLAGGYFGIRGETRYRYKDISAAVDPMLKDIIASHWDEKVIESYGSVAFQTFAKNPENKAKFDDALNLFRSFGEMKEYDGVTGFQGTAATTKVRAEARFEKYPARITLNLTKENGQWRINNLNVHGIVSSSGSQGGDNAK